MAYKTIAAYWDAYRNYIYKVVLSETNNDLRDITYWRNKIFCNLLTALTPLSIIALIPSIYMSFANKLPVVGITDIVAFWFVLLIMFKRKLILKLRKIIFIVTLYSVAVILVCYVTTPAPGLLLLLAITIFASITYSSEAAYFSAWINTFLCIVYGAWIYWSHSFSVEQGYDLGTWIAVSSNLVFLNFGCSYCLTMLLKGLATSMEIEKKSEANLAAIIQNTEANIYSIDRDFRYIIFNEVLKNNIKRAFNIDIKPGDNILSLYGNPESEEVIAWRNIYTRAFDGNSLRFEKEFNVGEHRSTMAFSVNPIIENKKVIGLSCFSVDITASKLAELERIKITTDLLQRNKALEQFSYIVSHNLRAPVANILGLSAIIQDEQLEPHVKKEFSAAIWDCVKKLDDVIIDLNSILKVTDRISEKTELVHFSQLANDVYLSIEQLVEKEKAVVAWDFSEIDEILALKTYLHSIFYNLISNSLKYRQPDVFPVIHIKSHKLKDRIVLLFKDNGMGIDLKRKGEQMFGLYKRFHTNGVEGKGMGLYMVRTQVETIGGKISVESEVNTGTTFKIEFET